MFGVMAGRGSSPAVQCPMWVNIGEICGCLVAFQIGLACEGVGVRARLPGGLTVICVGEGVN